MRLTLLAGAAMLALAACSQQATEQTTAPVVAETTTETVEPAPAEAAHSADTLLDSALAAQADEVKARYQWRHPKETLQFFGIAPGMTVVEVLPGDGWYTRILLDYLGATGRLIAADYPADMWALFGDYAPTPESRATWVADTTAQIEGWRGADDASVGAVVFGAIPESAKGAADAVLLIRAVHHFTRLEDEGQYMTKALADINALLKSGGVVGVVAHRAPAASADAWATGDNGYVKQDAVIAAFQNAGFVFEGASEVNANPADQPTESDMVWRLPPSLATSANNAELRAQMQAIGESDRMTLKFRKP